MAVANWVPLKVSLRKVKQKRGFIFGLTISLPKHTNSALGNVCLTLSLGEPASGREYFALQGR